MVNWGRSEVLMRMKDELEVCSTLEKDGGVGFKELEFRIGVDSTSV